MKDDRQIAYHGDLYMTECEKCKVRKEKGLHTHHITFQCTFKEELIDRIHEKDKLHNLVVLCGDCHESLHRGEWKIDGWKDSTMGRVLEWSIMEKEKEKEKEVVEVKKKKIMGENGKAVTEKGLS